MSRFVVVYRATDGAPREPDVVDADSFRDQGANGEWIDFVKGRRETPVLRVRSADVERIDIDSGARWTPSTGMQGPPRTRDPFVAFSGQDIQNHLAALDPAALAELRRSLEATSDDRISILQALAARPLYGDPANVSATLIEMADQDEELRLHLLRAIRDLSN